MEKKNRYIINFESNIGKNRGDIEVLDKKTNKVYFVDLKYDNKNEKVKAKKLYNEKNFTEEYYQQLFKILKLLYDKKMDKDIYKDLKDIKLDTFINKLTKDYNSMNFIKQYILSTTNSGDYPQDYDVVDYVATRYTNQVKKGHFAENLNYYSELRGLTPSDMANKLGYPVSTVNDWYNGVSRPTEGKIRALANALYISPRELKESPELRELRNSQENSLKNETVKIPVLGSIPAGIPNEAIEYIEDWEEIPKAWANSDKDFFALKIRGNSMYDTYHDGDIVIFERASRCDSGKNCAVLIDNTEVTFKKFIQTEAGIILQPLNEKEFEPIFYSKKQVLDLNIRIIGVPRELRRQNSL